MRRSLVLEAGGYDEAIRYATDWDLWLRLILDGARAGCLMEPLAHYRLQRGSLSSQLASMHAGRVAILEKAARRRDLSDEERAELERMRCATSGSRTPSSGRARRCARERPGARGLSLRAAGTRGRRAPHPAQAAGGRGGAACGRPAAARAARRDDRRSAARSQ